MAISVKCTFVIYIFTSYAKIENILLGGNDYFLK